MAKKCLLDGVVTANEWQNNSYFKLTLAFNSMPEVLPGQFVELRIDETPEVFLRRPISIHNIDGNNMELLIQKVGKGTEWLSKLKEDDKVNVLFPLGNGFGLNTSENSSVLLVGGGVGVAPLLYLGKKLKETGVKVNFLLGFRSSKEMLPLEAYEASGEVYITTEDGSVGEKGFVTNHSIWDTLSFDKIYSCGPTPMMKAVANKSKEKSIDCEVSLENKMACGLGACLCCVTDTKEGHRCVCTDGPVFNINDLKW